MGLFGKKREGQKSCCCGSNDIPKDMVRAEAAK